MLEYLRHKAVTAAFRHDISIKVLLSYQNNELFEIQFF